jgi:predicted nucleic acid-binding protein
MMGDRLFLDTAFIQALLNPRDDYHNQAKELFPFCLKTPISPMLTSRLQLRQTPSK